MAGKCDNKKKWAYSLNIKSKFIIKHLFPYLTQKKILYIIKYNKNFQEILNKNINDYIDESLKIEIEITPIEKIYN